MGADPFLLGELISGSSGRVQIRAAAGGAEPRLLGLRLDPGAEPGGIPWPEWVRAGEPLAMWAAPGGGAAPGHPVAWFMDGGRETPAISTDGEYIIFHFDPAAAAAYMTSERYVQSKRPLHTYAPWLVSALPGPARLLGHQVASRVERLRHGRRRQGGELEFPQFPVERSVELIRLLLRRGAGLEGRAPWPGGAGAVAMITCDVDTAEGQARIPAIAQEAERLGLKSCFYVVGDRFPLDHGLLSRLADAGHEIGLHGAKHDMRLAYLNYQEVVSRLDRCRDLTERHQVTGFRSPALLTSPAITRALAGRFDYDSSVPDTDVDTVAAPRRGCGSLFPYWQGSLVQIPLTLPLDDRLLLRGEEPEQMVNTWRRKMAWIREVGGGAMVTTHAEPHLGGSPRLLSAYRRLLEGIAEEDWTVLLPRDVAEHFKQSYPPLA